MIAIKDRKMPSCCVAYDSDNDYYIGCPFYKICEQRETVKTNYKPINCPLVEIVTCKECKHRDKVHPSWLSNKKDEVYFCTLQSDEYCYEVEDDFYCKDAERRE